MKELRTVVLRVMSVVLLASFLSSCVPPAPEKSAPVSDSPTVGTVDDTQGFKVNACKSVEDTSCTQGNYFIHQKGKRQSACEVAASATAWADRAIDCVAEVPESDLEAFSIQLNYNVPSTMCEHLVLKPYYYWQRKPGKGPSNVIVRRDASGKVIRNLINMQSGLTATTNLPGTAPNTLTLTGVSTSLISVGTPVQFYRGDARKIQGGVVTRNANATNTPTPAVFKDDGAAPPVNLTPVDERIWIWATKTGVTSAQVEFGARGSVSGELGTYTLSGSGPYEFTVQRAGVSLVRVTFTETGSNSVSNFKIGDSFVITTFADTSKNPMVSVYGQNLGNGVLKNLVFGSSAHSGDKYSITITGASTDSGTFTVTKAPGSYGSANTLLSGTVGTAYVSDEIMFTIADGTLDFVPGDTFEVTVDSDELPSGLKDGVTYTVDTIPSAGNLTLKKNGAVVNRTADNGKGSFLFGVVPSSSGLKTGAAVDSTTGLPTCDYDYSTLEDNAGPNCCAGKYDYYAETYQDGVVLAPNATRLDWGGLMSSCLAGPAMKTQTLGKNGWPLLSTYSVSGTGRNAVYAVPKSDQMDGTTIRQANYTVATLTPGAQTSGPAVLQTYDGASVHPYYEWICMDRAYEVKARIRVQVREWNEKEQLLAYRDCTTSDSATSNCDVQFPDDVTPSNASHPATGPDTGGTEPNGGYPINDAWDLDDFGAVFPGDAGFSVTSQASAKAWNEWLKAPRSEKMAY